MVANVAAEISQFADRLRTAVPGADVELSSYPTGAAMLDLRRDGRLFVMAFSPSLGFGVDEVRDGEGLLASYRYVFQDFQPAADKLVELAASSTPIVAASPALELVVVYADDLAKSKTFYETLGLTLTHEKHNGGPDHYSCQVGGAVFEIYPRPKGQNPSPVRLGFRVACVDETVEQLEKIGASLVSRPRESSRGRLAVVRDPNGHTVELISGSKV